MTADYLDRVVREVLGGVEMWVASQDGPNGPWNYRSLRVTRRGNTIQVWDVDGRLYDTLAVGDLPTGDGAYLALHEWLESCNEESLAEL